MIGTAARTVQQYIDEVPAWRDGTPATAGAMTSMQKRIWLLASAGKFFEGMIVFMVGVALPTSAPTASVSSHPPSSRRLWAQPPRTSRPSPPFDNDLQGTEGAVMIDAFLLIGIVLAVVLVDRFGRIRLQVFGFLGCAVGLVIAALSTVMTGTLQIVLVFAGFMLFNLMTNLGPNSMTYLLAGEVFPTHLRGTGAGMAASVAKVGAVLTAFLFPILLEEWGTAPSSSSWRAHRCSAP